MSFISQLFLWMITDAWKQMSKYHASANHLTESHHSPRRQGTFWELGSSPAEARWTWGGAPLKLLVDPTTFFRGNLISCWFFRGILVSPCTSSGDSIWLFTSFPFWFETGGVLSGDEGKCFQPLRIKNAHFESQGLTSRCCQRLPNKLYPTKKNMRNTNPRNKPSRFWRLPNYQPTLLPTQTRWFKKNRPRSNCKWCSECDLSRFWYLANRWSPIRGGKFAPLSFEGAFYGPRFFGGEFIAKTGKKTPRKGGCNFYDMFLTLFLFDFFCCGNVVCPSAFHTGLDSLDVVNKPSKKIGGE